MTPDQIEEFLHLMRCLVDATERLADHFCPEVDADDEGTLDG